ncbi:MAG: rhamnulokinase [Epulopiscium sp.]|nr:rhamnulokinase [Candidatus Epulonipiscium sp.]
MSKICIAVDIGASSGRVIAGILDNGKISLKEIYRFKNGIVKSNDHSFWDLDRLYNEILEGLKKLAEENIGIESIGIDTWAIDYVLLDANNEKVSPVYAYRDHRTDSTMEKVFKEIDAKEIYSKTGIQFLQFNTLYQLYEHMKAEKERLAQTDTFLMVPDYLNYLLSNQKVVEFTNATTTQMFNIHNNDWDEDLIKITGFDKKVFPKTIKPGTILGNLTKKVQEATGLGDIKVIAPATHDTGSAVAAVPATSADFAYISSGTWSLMGIESNVPITTEEARKYNFTNEGGVFNTYRVLKNIMGMWLIQEVQRLYDYQYSFAELVELAKKEEPFKYLINPNHPRFLNPQNMIEEIQNYCEETHQGKPETPGQISRCIYESLALQYNEVLGQLREITKEDINRIHIIGGGAQNKFLNQLCADATNCEVYAGPVEATALGNLMMQFIAIGELTSLEEARKVILNSFDVEKYVPNNIEGFRANWDRFKQLP